MAVLVDLFGETRGKVLHPVLKWCIKLRFNLSALKGSGRSAAWLARLPWEQEVECSNHSAPTTLKDRMIKGLPDAGKPFFIALLLNKDKMRDKIVSAVGKKNCMAEGRIDQGKESVGQKKENRF